jgi:hypothetical protein
MAPRQREIQEQILLIASLHRKREAHRRKPVVKERKWRREDGAIVQRLAKAYAALAQLRRQPPEGESPAGGGQD